MWHGSAFRGGEGRLEVTQGSLPHPMYDVLLQAGAQSGQGTSADLNGRRPVGIARFDRTVSASGRRCSAADAHLRPALRRPNLTLATVRACVHASGGVTAAALHAPT